MPSRLKVEVGKDGHESKSQAVGGPSAQARPEASSNRRPSFQKAGPREVIVCRDEPRGATHPSMVEASRKGYCGGAVRGVPEHIDKPEGVPLP